jgi:hypothetical protein
MAVDKVHMRPPASVGGQPKEVEATPAVLIPLMVKGWTQCEAPALSSKKKERVTDGESA